MSEWLDEQFDKVDKDLERYSDLTLEDAGLKPSKPDIDMFGYEHPPERGKHYRPAKGYAGTPGKGKEGETCKTCDSCVATHTSRNRFYKCRLIGHRWTYGRGTDILVRSPACEHWKPLED